ncbi:MAG: heme peroxidase, partial [Armatimonadetes bacterium]|nr:heme peroxidase [Armatimonadota bacterium]
LGEHIHKLLGRVSGSEVISGIPGSQTDHFGVPYSITEEFVAVYRMHPLIPDDYQFRSAATDELLRECTLPEMAGLRAHDVLEQVSMTDLFYSFGVAHPGAVTLHNYPRSLQRFERPDGFLMDMAALDVLRTRELGVPRYNQFRRLLHLRPARTFEELTPNPEWAEQIRRVYDGDIERVDLMVGLFAEQPPKGFGFSDTAFRIFILMASRRLNSDRFFTTDFTPEVYSPVGMQWIDDNTMSTVLLRHYPGLAPALRGVANAFAPWNRVGGSGAKTD